MNFSVRDDGIYMFNVKKRLCQLCTNRIRSRLKNFFFSNVFSSSMSLAEKELVSGSVKCVVVRKFTEKNVENSDLTLEH